MLQGGNCGWKSMEISHEKAEPGEFRIVGLVQASKAG